MLGRPTLGACIIAKNEEQNIGRCLSSIKGLVDEIYVTDTGSTDKTVEIAKNYGAHISHFEWVNDFAKARNFNLKQAKTDYVLWIDCDDVMQNPENFKLWRDSTMAGFDYWIATYHYASDPATDRPVVSFARERVINRLKGMEWKYFIHEGIMPFGTNGQVRVGLVHSWQIKHMRTINDLEKDKGRNIRIFEAHKDELDSRMLFYFGKEKFEAGDHAGATELLGKAVVQKDLEGHDRILAQQYLCYSLMMTGKLHEAIQVAQTGLLLAPHRAEFWVVIGDCYAKQNRLAESLPYYAAAKECPNRDSNADRCMSPLFAFGQLYTTYPRNSLSRAYVQLGNLDQAYTYAKESQDMGDDEGRALAAEIKNIQNNFTSKKEPCSDIVLTCLGSYYPWDENIWREKGCGGSETAAIFLTKYLKELTGRRVIIFNPRDDEVVCSGVEYVSLKRANEYFSKYDPALHIAWRHNVKITNSKTVLWSHDLLAPGINITNFYEAVAVLTPFHKNYLKSIIDMPDEKMWVTRNGIIPENFPASKGQKNPYKVVFTSSPDRGLCEAMKVMDIVRQERPEAELHAFYGFDNMRKGGMQDEANMLEGMIKERPWVKMHGNVAQKDLLTELSTSAVWLYPTWFLETFCISALEALGNGVYPVTRRIGGLADTLKEAESQRMATLLDHGADTPEQLKAYAHEVLKAIHEKAYERVSLDLEKHNWRAVAKEWVARWLTTQSTAQS